MFIENIQNPSSVKKLSIDELNLLAQEIRTALINKLSVKGGHCGPNLGMVEVTIALHYVFNSPLDKIIFDVSHQSYTHKILTGRNKAFLDSTLYNSVSGYTDPKESEHDFFNIGHTSTSISLASGLAKARDLKNEKYNVIAVIGDGSLSGGEALEGLDYISELKSNMIVLVNDNDMSIAENHGGIYSNLKLLRETKGNAECNLFKSFGLDYCYIENGNDVEQLIAKFKEIKDIDHPIVIHMVTKKGKGFQFAENEKEKWHWHMPFDPKTGENKSNDNSETYDGVLSNYLFEKTKNDKLVSLISAGTPMVMGMDLNKRTILGDQFIDVGIAEEHAMAMASGLAANGTKPIFGVYSTFLQRTYDQISQDLCINGNSATVLVYAASIDGMSDITHIGYYDIPMISNIPNLVYLAPTNKDELLAMTEWAVEQNKHPVFIRVPVGKTKSSNKEVQKNYDDLNKFEMVQSGSKVAIIGVGNFFDLAVNCSKIIKEKLGWDTTIINPRFVSGIDEQMLSSLETNHNLVITIEDGILDGGFGEKISRYYGSSHIKVLNYGLRKIFRDRYNSNEVKKQEHLEPNIILEDIQKVLNNSNC